jgi:putative redox protein
VPTERFQFTGEGGHQLAAALDLPEGPPLAYALFAHCFTCGKDVLAAKRIAVALASKGIAVLRFDFTGLGSSEGDFRQCHILLERRRPGAGRRSTCAKPERRRRS